MLVLKLYRDQRARVGPHVVLHVLRVGEHWVKIGIDAPPEWLIGREPLHVSVNAELHIEDANKE